MHDFLDCVERVENESGLAQWLLNVAEIAQHWERMARGIGREDVAQEIHAAGDRLSAAIAKCALVRG